MFRPARILLTTALVLTGLGFGLTNSADAAGRGRSGGRTASSYRNGRNLGYRRHGYRHHGHHHYYGHGYRHGYRHHDRYRWSGYRNYWNRYYGHRYNWNRYPSWWRTYRYNDYGYAAPAVTTVAPAQVTAAVEPPDMEEAGPPEPSFEPEPIAPPVARSAVKPLTKAGPTIIQSVKVVKPRTAN
jgi:hypothetical protein